MKNAELMKHYSKKYPLTFRGGDSSNDPLLTKRYDDAWVIARKAAKILKSNYEAKKVAVFGSLTERSLFTRWSDIDIAVWGVPDDKFYAAVGAVTGLSAKFKVDLVDATDCRDSLRKALEIEGIVI